VPEIPFGPYTLVRRLAVGGMAEVYLATLAGPRGFEKKVVVKQILPQLAREPELLQLFFDEAAIAQKLVHPGVVQVFDVGQHDGTHYMAMEFVDGLDLDDLVRRAVRTTGLGLPVPLAVRVVLDLARAVHYAHEAKDDDGTPLDVIHRDISPQNVLLGRDGSVKLGDFGIARTSLRARRTQTGVLRGKISYLAPERFSGARAERGVDVYAMGVVLFECVAGKRPFVGDDALLIRKILHEPTPRLAEAVPGVDPRLDTLVAQAMARDPAERLPSARALAEGLSALGLAAALAELGAYVSRTADRSTEPPRPSAAPAKRSTETLPGRLDDPEAPLVAEAALRAETSAMPVDERPRVYTVAEADALAPLLDTTRAMPLEGPEQTRLGPPPSPPPGAHSGSRPTLGERAARAGVGVLDLARRRPAAAVLSVCTSGLLVGWLATRAWMGPPPVSTVAGAPARPLALPEGEADAERGRARPEEGTPVAVLPAGEDGRSAAEAARAEAQVVEGGRAARGVDEDTRVGAAVEPAERAKDDTRAVDDLDRKARRPKRVVRPRPGAAEARPALGARAEVGEGEVSIDSEPWAYVQIDGKDLGPTPLAHVRLPAGAHRVRLENPEARLVRVVPLVIQADRRTTLRIRLSDGVALRP
jgi:serine/threonine-protein kinase